MWKMLCSLCEQRGHGHDGKTAKEMIHGYMNESMYWEQEWDAGSFSTKESSFGCMENTMSSKVSRRLYTVP